MAINTYAPVRAPEPGVQPTSTDTGTGTGERKIDIMKMLNSGMTHEQIMTTANKMKLQGGYVDQATKDQYAQIAPQMFEQMKKKNAQKSEKKDGFVVAMGKEFGRTVAKPFGEVAASVQELRGKQAPKWTENKRLASPSIRAAMQHGITPEAKTKMGELKESGAEGAGFTDVMNALSFMPGAGTAMKGVSKLGKLGKAPLSKFTQGALGKFSTKMKGSAMMRGSLGSAKWGAGYGAAGAADEGGTFGEIAKAGTIGGAMGAALPPGFRAGSKLLGGITRRIPGLSKFAASQFTGLSPHTISTLVKNPKAIKGAQKKVLDRAKLGNRVKEGIDKRLSDLGTTGKKYNVLRESTQTVTVGNNKIQGLLDKYKIKFKGGKIATTAESMPMSQTDKTALGSFLSTFKDETMSANAFLNARTALSNMAGFEQGKTGASKKLAKELRAIFDQSGKSQLKGLSALDAKFGPETKLLRELKKSYIDKDGTLKKTALTKIAGLTKKGREKELSLLDNVVPGIKEDINILRALEDIEYASGQKVGAYMRGAVGGFALTGGNPIGALISSIVSSPTVAVPLLVSYGTAMNVSRNVMQTIVSKMVKGTPLRHFEKKTLGSIMAKIADDAKGGKTYTPKLVSDVLGVGAPVKNLQSMMRKAPAAKKEIDSIAQKLADKHGGIVAAPGIKKMPSALRKLKTEQWDASKMQDLARNTVVVDKHNIEAIFKDLQSMPGLKKITKVDPKLDPLGYGGINAKLNTKSGIVSEIQANTPQMIFAKEPAGDAMGILGKKKYNELVKTHGDVGGKGHKFYEAWRLLNKKTDKAKMLKIENSSKKYYKEFI